LGGESSGLSRLTSYLTGTHAIATYKETRNGLLGTDYSTKFSPFLALGSLSPRKIYFEIKRYEETVTKNDSTYWVIFELMWRDYFRFVAEKEGNKIFLPTGIRADPTVQWNFDTNIFNKWKGNLSLSLSQITIND
jgi:deoxyribodipyrimidine photo-lyase